MVEDVGAVVESTALCSCVPTETWLLITLQSWMVRSMQTRSRTFRERRQAAIGWR
jgi:hypothetical protein